MGEVQLRLLAGKRCANGRITTTGATYAEECRSDCFQMSLRLTLRSILRWHMNFNGILGDLAPWRFWRLLLGDFLRFSLLGEDATLHRHLIPILRPVHPLPEFRQ